MDTIKPPSVEELIHILASACDGAKKKDGIGFNKGDSQDGRRLSAMVKANISWNVDDAKRAMSLIQRYSKQTIEGYCGNDVQKKIKISQDIAYKNVVFENEPVPNEEKFNYCCLSSGGTKAYIYFWKFTSDFDNISREIKMLNGKQHGTRNIHVRFKPSVELKINHKKKRCKRWEVEFNGTSREKIIEICKNYSIAIDPVITNPLDSEFDNLIKAERIMYIITATRNKKEGQWAVFDLESKDPTFTRALKKYFPKKYTCDRHDDWNWLVMLDKETAPIIEKIIPFFKFEVDKESRDILKNI